MDIVQSFIKAFNTVNQNESDQIKSIWHKNLGLFTKYMLDSENSFLKLVSKELNMECYTNGRMGYYFLDAVLFKPEDNISGNTSETWLKNIRIAIEHENMFDSNLFQEVSRLLITKCNLRVLITYYDCKPDEFYYDELNKLHQIIKSVPDSQEIAISKSFLLIVGAGTKPQPSWEINLFGSTEWIKLQSLL